MMRGALARGPIGPLAMSSDWPGSGCGYLAGIGIDAFWAGPVFAPPLP